MFIENKKPEEKIAKLLLEIFCFIGHNIIHGTWSKCNGRYIKGGC